MPPEITPESKIAILVIDDNNDFLAPGGRLYNAVAPSLEANQVLERLNHLLALARSARVPVVRLPMSFGADFAEMGPAPYGIFKTVKDLGAFVSGSWGAEPAETIVADERDLVLRGKSSACAFATTSLQDWLAGQAIDTLILTGLLSNICVEATMRTAYDRGFQVIVPVDCVAALSDGEHAGSIANNWPHFAKITDAHSLALKFAQASVNA